MCLRFYSFCRYTQGIPPCAPRNSFSSDAENWHSSGLHSEHHGFVQRYWGSARGLCGFSPTFPIAQGTREGCILSPLLFLIFFADIICVLEPVNLDEGPIMMGALYLARILFADDVFKFPTTGSLMMRGSGRLSLSLAARLTREYLRVPFWLFFNKR